MTQLWKKSLFCTQRCIFCSISQWLHCMNLKCAIKGDVLLQLLCLIKTWGPVEDYLRFTTPNHPFSAVYVKSFIRKRLLLQINKTSRRDEQQSSCRHSRSFSLASFMREHWQNCVKDRKREDNHKERNSDTTKNKEKYGAERVRGRNREVKVIKQRSSERVSTRGAMKETP